MTYFTFNLFLLGLYVINWNYELSGRMLSEGRLKLILVLYVHIMRVHHLLLYTIN